MKSGRKVIPPPQGPRRLESQARKKILKKMSFSDERNTKPAPPSGSAPRATGGRSSFAKAQRPSGPVRQPSRAVLQIRTQIMQSRRGMDRPRGGKVPEKLTSRGSSVSGSSEDSLKRLASQIGGLNSSAKSKTYLNTEFSAENLENLPDFPGGDDSELARKFFEWQIKAVPRVLCSDSTIRKLHELVMTPVPEGENFCCQVEKISHLDSSRPFYVLTLPMLQGKDSAKDSNDQETYHEKRIAIMTAKKTGTSLKSRFIITLEPDDFSKPTNKRSKWYFGKLVLRSRHRFILYDSGKSMKPNRKGIIKKRLLRRKESSDSDYYDYDSYGSEYSELPTEEKEHSVDSSVTSEPNRGQQRTVWQKNPRKVCFSSTITTRLKNKSPREMTVFIPSAGELEEVQYIIDEHRLLSESLNTYLSAKSLDNRDEVKTLLDKGCFLVLRDQSKRKRPTISSLVRYPVAPSIKNYELDRCELKRGKLEFGKANSQKNEQLPITGMARIGTKRFFLVVRSPLTVYQAFGICLTRLEATKSLASRVNRNIF